MKKHSIKAFSLLLVMCMLISALPNVAPVSAVEAGEIPTFPITETTTGPEETFAAIGSTPSSDLSIIQEEVSLRKEYEKHFLMSDGSYQVALYNEPIHQLKDGEWVEIDNTLALQTAVDGTAQYRTANGLADVSFAQSYGEQLVSMQKDEHSISWGVQAVSSDSTMSATASTESLQPVQAELVPADTSSLSADEQKAFAVKSSSAIRYHDALREDVDLEYIVLPSRIKENIILQSPQDISYYVVTVYTENLSAQLLENRRIEFYDSSDEVVFTMSSPYMYDSAAELSENITVEMTSKGDGCYLIKMTPDAQWLNDQDRVYPVVIDPELSADTTQQNIIDNYVLEGSGVQNNNLDRLYIGVKSGYKARAYIQYATMPTLPSGATITAASMTVQILSGTSTANNASAYMVTGADWASGTITWDNKPAASTLLASNISHNSKTRYTFSCKTAVQTWYSGSTTGQNKNYGVMIRYYDETIADYNSVYSADHSDETKRPALTITYQPSSSSASVVEGATCTLTAPSTTGTITWSSSDTSVATVNSSGKVTGIKAGVVTISASVSGTVQKTYTVHVCIADGVYRIKNANTGLYLGTYGIIADNTPVKLLAYSSNATTQLYQLWKITYLGSGYYSIRPLYKLDMALHATSSTVDITNTGKADTYSDVSSYNRWSIVYGTTGYNINNVGTNSRALKHADGAISPGLDVVIAANGGTSTSFDWVFNKVTNPPSGILLYDLSTGTTIDLLSSRYIAAGTTKTLEDLDFAAYAYSGNAATTENITWSCISGSSNLTVNPSTGTITALSPGTSLITGSSNYGNFNLYITVTGSSTTDFTFINQYDVSFVDDPELVGFIDDAVNFVNIAYQKQFSISFSSSTNPYYRAEAITDDCPLPFYESCHNDDQCGDSCNASHHKNLYRISNHIYSSTIPQDHVVVFWTDRDFESYCLDGMYAMDEDTVMYALVYQHRPVIHMMTIEDDTSGRMYCMANNLAHEFAHTLGMEDYYNDTAHSDGDWHCVMDKYDSNDIDGLRICYQNVLNGNTNLFCSSCETQIDALLAGSS